MHGELTSRALSFEFRAPFVFLDRTEASSITYLVVGVASVRMSNSPAMADPPSTPALSVKAAAAPAKV